MFQGQSLVREIIEILQRERPQFHGQKQAGKRNYSIQSRVLKWMANNIPQGANTLETGCGYSTLVLASLSARHTVISPFPEEHELIKVWCADREISIDHVDFIASPSQDVVPHLACDRLDFILIDGDHAFPAPFIDWYYTADKLKVGGYLAVDDTQIPTGKILRDFLIEESKRWRLATEINKTAIFARTSNSEVAKGISWGQQPYCKIPKKTRLEKVKSNLEKKLRDYVRRDRP